MSDDVGRVALPIIGLGAGLVFGNPALGFFAGSVAAQLIYPVKQKPQEQSLITDWRLPQTGLGVDIPYLFAGSDRLPGLLTYHGGVKAVTIEHEEGGKGGGSQTVSETFYYATFSIICCTPEATAIRRQWFGGTLIYDASVNNLGPVSKYSNNIFPRLGTETQVAHPSIQAAVGANRAPAYRGRPGVDYVNFPLADFSNQAYPFPSVEVVNAPATHVCQPLLLANGFRTLFVFGGHYMWSYDRFRYQASPPGDENATVEIKKIDVVGNTTLARLDVADAEGDLNRADTDHLGNLYIAARADPGDPTDQTGWVVRHDFNTLARTATGSSIKDYLQPLVIGCAIKQSEQTGETYTSHIYAINYGTANDTGVKETWLQVLEPEALVTLSETQLVTVGASPGTISQMAIDVSGVGYFVQQGDDDEHYLFIFSEYGLEQVYALRDLDSIFDDYEAAEGSFYVSLEGYDATTHSLLLGIGATVASHPFWLTRMSIDSLSVEATLVYEWLPITSISSFAGMHQQAIKDGFAWVDINVEINVLGFQAVMMQQIDVVQMVEIRQVVISRDDCPEAGPRLLSFTPYDVLCKSFLTMMNSNQSATYPDWEEHVTRVYIDRVDNESDATLQDTVDAILDATREDSLPRDTSPLAPYGVVGYSSLRRTASRGILEPSCRDRGFNLIESDAQFKAVKRGGAVSDVLTEDDLGAANEDDYAPLVEVTRLHNLNLPERIDLKYRSKARDYNTNDQHARLPRDLAITKAPTTITSPVVMTDDQAKEIVTVWRDTADLGQVRVKTTLFPEKQWYDPGMLIQMPVEGEDRIVYIEQVTIGINRLVEIVGSLDDPDAWSQDVTGAANDSQDFFDDSTLAVPGLSRLYLIDGPLLRDQDDTDYGPYAAIVPYRPANQGAVVYRATAEGNFAKVLSVPQARLAIGGDTLTALPSTEKLYVLDDVSTVDVRLLHSDMALESITELQALNGENAALIGDEVVIFQTATQLNDTDWRLSDLRRAERGTEWAVDIHSATERFLLLSSTTTFRLPMNLSDKDVETFYRAVSIGDSFLDAPIRSFTWTGIEKKPLSPVFIESELNGTDKDVTWVGRSRVGGDLVDGVDVPLAEESLAYRIYVYDSDTSLNLLNTYSVATEAWTYTLAEYNADFSLSASQVGDVFIAIVQVSADVGDGFPTYATI